MGRSLLLLADDARALDDLLDHAAANDGNLDIAEQEAIETWVGELDTAAASKADSIGWLLREWEARAEARRAQAKKLVEAAQADENRGARLRAYVLECLQRMGRTELQGASCALKVTRNGGKAPLVLSGPVPAAYEVVVRSPDRDAIRAALERGEAVDGAALGERGVSLRVR